MRALLFVVSFAIALALPGCPPPEPLTERDCPTAETRKNCGLCSSDPACAWCASATPEQVGCYDRASAIVCDGPIIRVLEACEGPDERLFRED